MEKNYAFIEGGTELIVEIKPLWEALNVYHQNKAVHFSEKIRENTFDKRHERFFSGEFKVHVEIIKVNDQTQPIGYCICTISSDGIGEIDSLYIEDEHRGSILGQALMNNALEWLQSNKTTTNRIKVAEGNESALNFYKKFGFETRYYILEEIAIKDNQ